MRSWPLVHSGAFAIMPNLPTHRLYSLLLHPSNAHTSGTWPRQRVLSIISWIRASIFIFWNGFRSRQMPRMV